MNMLLKGTLFMLTLDRLLNVTIYLGYFYFSFHSLLLLLREGLIYYFSIWNFLIFGAQIIIGMKFFITMVSPFTQN